MSRSIFVILLHSLIARAHTSQPLTSDTGDLQNSTDDSIKMLAESLVSRSLKAQPLHHVNLDDTTLRKTGHVATPQRALHLTGSFSRLPAPLQGVGSAPLAVPTVRDTTSRASQTAKTWDEMAAPPGGASYRDWLKAYMSMVERDLKAVTPKEALNMVQDQKAVIVDVRMSDSIWDIIDLPTRFKSGTLSTFKERAIEGSVNVPLFRRIEGMTPFDIIKRLNAYMFMVDPTERNPNFGDIALEKLTRDQPIIVTCQRGGEIVKQVQNRKTKVWRNLTKEDVNMGMRYTASLKACHELYKLGFTKIFLLDGGVYEWEMQGLPMVYDRLLN